MARRSTPKPSKTSCGDEHCLKIWPALVLPAGVTAATAGSGVSAAKLGTTMRSGGVLQVTYGGKPLYYFVGDTSAGKVTGDITDKWGKWSAVVTKKRATPAPAPAPGPATPARAQGAGLPSRHGRYYDNGHVIISHIYHPSYRKERGGVLVFRARRVARRPERGAR